MILQKEQHSKKRNYLKCGNFELSTCKYKEYSRSMEHAQGKWTNQSAQCISIVAALAIKIPPSESFSKSINFACKRLFISPPQATPITVDNKLCAFCSDAHFYVFGCNEINNDLMQHRRSAQRWSARCTPLYWSNISLQANESLIVCILLVLLQGARSVSMGSSLEPFHRAFWPSFFIPKRLEMTCIFFLLLNQMPHSYNWPCFSVSLSETCIFFNKKILNVFNSRGDRRPAAMADL